MEGDVEIPTLEHQEVTATRVRPLALVWNALALAAFVAVPAWLQFTFLRVTEDGDTDYHLAVARLIREHGILHAFPWTPFSLLAERYADKELLFHLLMVPFAYVTPATASNIAGTIAGALLLTAIFFVLIRERVRYAALWALVPLLASSAFVYRFSLVRPHLLSIALALVVLWAASRERFRVLAAASVIYPWAYVAWQMPVVLAVLAEVARALTGKRPGWRGPAVALGAVAVGIAIHPNALNLVRFNWVTIVEILLTNAWGARTGFELGDEFRSFTGAEWAKLLAPPTAMVLGAAVLAWRRRREDVVPLAFALVATAFGLLTFRTARFTEYFVPFAVAAFALAAALLGARLGARKVLLSTLAVCLAYSASETWELLHRMQAREPRLSAEEATVMRAHIPSGAQVFTCEWGLTGTLMLAMPERKFIVALDPTLFAVQDPERYELWYRLPREAPPGLAKTIREQFGAQYVACLWDERYRAFFDRLAFEPGVNAVSMSGIWNVYELREP
jgi:hypothetical protein